MPVIGISVKQLNSLLGKPLSPEELSDTLEKLGCDIEGIAEVTLYLCPQCGTMSDKMVQEEPLKKCNTCGYEPPQPCDPFTRDPDAFPFRIAGSDQVIRLDLLPARPDFFDPGGLARALKGYLDIETGLPEYKVGPAVLDVNVDEKLAKEESYRPFIACAVVTMPALDSVLLRTMMKLQENLHWGIGRDRKLASIGIYDMATITPPVRYTAVKPDGIKFHPLGKPDILMTPAQILADHPKGVAYAHLLQPLQEYPLLIDKNDQVLSMPPIINSDETRLKLGSTKLFIDVTGITASDVRKSLNTLTTSLAELGGKIEGVKIVSKEGESITPNLKPGEIVIDLEAAKKWLGIDLKLKEAMKLLERMRFGVSGKSGKYHVRYPAFRSDIKHEVDIFEDMVIGYGFENMTLSLVPTMTIGKERDEEKLIRRVRDIMLGLSFDEIFSLTLTTKSNHFEKLLMDVPAHYPLLMNAKTVEYNVVRTHLMNSLLEAMVQNEKKPVPQKFFELGNVVLLDPSTSTGTIEEKRLAIGIIGPTSGYAEIRSVLDAVLYELGWKAQYEPLQHPSFLPGRCAKVTLCPNQSEGKTCTQSLTACLGELHPKVLLNFGLAHPAAIAEVSLARLFEGI